MERTKMAIIAAFEALLEEKPFNKITVKDIVERCQINRNTFYYHYRDIPDLLQHMLEGKVDRLLSGHYIPDCPMACISPIFQYGLEHKRAILHIYRYTSRDTFLPYLEQGARYLVEQYFSSMAKELGLSDSDTEVLVYFYRCTLVGMTLDWLEDGMREDILHTVQQICDLLEGATRQALLKNKL